MSAQAVTLAGRLQAEALMVDACVIERLAGQTFDETSGTYVDTWSEVYAGKCRVQAQDVLRVPEEQAGEQLYVLRRATLSVPMSVTDVRVDDRVTVTASALDPDLANRVYRVTDLAHKTYLTARRLPIEEVTSG